MIVQCDDDLYRVDRVFLGPKGRPWPFRMTYRGYGFWATLTVVGVIVWRLLHLPWSVIVLIAMAITMFFAAKWLDKHLTSDRPITAEINRAWQELTAPRPDLTPSPTVWSVPLAAERWRAGARSNGNWLARTLSTIGRNLTRAGTRLIGRRRGRIYINGSWQDVH